MKITFLGTSGFGETSTRNTVAILLDDQILIDAGEGVTRRLLKRDGTAEVTHIFLTHGHLDHIIGLFPLLWQYIIVEHRENPLVIVCPTYVGDAIQQIFDLTHFPPMMHDFPLELHTLDVNSSNQFKVNIPGYEVTALLMQHSPPCIGYRFTTIEGKDIGKTFAFTGDSRPTSSMVKLAIDADFFITECTFPAEYGETAHHLNHLTPTDAALVAQKAGCARLGLIHHPDYILEHKLEVEAEIRDVFYTGEVIFCEDNAELSF